MAVKKQAEFEESEETKLCHKWNTNNMVVAHSLENTHQYILNIIKRPGALDNMKKSSQVYFSAKLQFEDEWQRNVVRSLWDFYQTKDERLKFWRNLTGNTYNRYMRQTYVSDRPYH